MGTRANIIVQTGPDVFKVTYLHSDAYPSGVGVILDRFHNSPAAARKIASLGSCSSLCVRLEPNVGEKHGFDYRDRAAFCSVFYKRERCEKGSVEKFTVLEAALEYSDNEYVYAWVTGEGWMIRDEDGTTLVPLDQFLKGDQQCRDVVSEMDENGMTLAWKDAGCPHTATPTDYGTEYTAIDGAAQAVIANRAKAYAEEAMF